MASRSIHVATNGKISFFFNILIYYFWLCCIFIAACGLSLAVASRGYSVLWFADFSLWWFLLLWATDSRAQA